MYLDEVRSRHGGYWRYPFVDFHYLFNHYFPPPELCRELQEALITLAKSYPSNQRVLAELLSAWKDANYFTADNLVVGNGSSELIKLITDRVIDRVTVPLPTFNEFVTGRPGALHSYPLDESEWFRLDVDRLLREVRASQSDTIVLVNPNNPVGSLVPLTAIRRILETGVTLVIDEAFMPFADPACSAEPLVRDYANLVIVASCTKSVGIAGLRLGYVLTSNAAVKRSLRDALPIWNVNAVAEYVIEALPRYRRQFDESLQQIRADTRWFHEALLSVSYLEPYPTHANAVFCRVNGSGRRLAEILLERHNLIVKDGVTQAGWRSEHSYVRIGLRNREDNRALLAALHGIDPRELHDGR